MNKDVNVKKKKNFISPSGSREIGCLLSPSNLIMFFKYNLKNFKYNLNTLYESFIF